MSASLENWQEIQELVAMSIGTDKGSWWGDGNFGSDLFILRQEGKVDGNTAGRFKRMVEECLAWMLEDGVVKSFVVDANRSGKNRIDYSVEVIKPNGDNFLIKDVWNV